MDVFSFGSKKKLQGTRSSEYGGWGMIMGLFLAKQCSLIKFFQQQKWPRVTKQTETENWLIIWTYVGGDMRTNMHF